MAQPASAPLPSSAVRSLPRVPELDGLRALLAWWVVVYHIGGPTFTGAIDVEFGPLRLLSQGFLAVKVFMILSGFVIFFLLDRAHESYGVFAMRRFLRLYPVYAVCFVVMLALQGLYTENLRANADHLAPDLLAAMVHDAEQPVRDLAAQLAVHAPMLHGTVPDMWLENAAGAFLMPAWSISLEWQFYLVAPFVFQLVRRFGAAGGAAWLLLTAVAFATRGAWPSFEFEAFLPLQLHWFTIGIASYYVFKHFATAAQPSALLRLAPSAVAVAFVALVLLQIARLGLARGTTPSWWFPMVIWSFAFAVLLAAVGGLPGPVTRGVQRALRSRALVRLGTVSYSTYLAHWPVLVLCQAAFRTAIPDLVPATAFALHLVISCPLVAATSFALYRFVEEPGIALGRRLSHRASPGA